jgi:hypothetical protein
MPRIPRPVYLGAVIWTLGTVGFVAVDHTLSGPSNPEHLTSQQQDERQERQEDEERRRREGLLDGIDADRNDRLTPGEHRPPVNPGKGVARRLLR